MSLTFLLCFVSFSLLFYSVDSCSTVSGSGVTLTGVCPNDTFTVPVGATLEYSCSYSLSGTFVTYWNVSGDIITANTDPFPVGVTSVTSNNQKSVITIVTMNTVHIQCGLCRLTECFTEFIGTKSIQLIAFKSTLFHLL